MSADFVREWSEPEALVAWTWRQSADLTAVDPVEIGTLSFDAVGPIPRVGEPGDLAGGVLDCAIDVIGLQDEPEKVTLYYDTVAAGQKVRHAALPVTVAGGQVGTLHAERTIRGEDVPSQADEVALWLTTRAFWRVQYASGRIPVEGWPAIAALPLDFVGTEVLSAQYDLSGLPLGAFEGSTLTCSLAADGAVRVSGQAAASARVVTLALPVAGLPPGEYALRAEVMGAGDGALGEVTQTVVIPDATPWLGNAIGLTDTVPEPFTPLEIDGPTVRCWGRGYTFGASGLPEQVTSQGESLLAAPVALELSAGGQAVSWEAGEPGLRMDGRDVRGRALGTAGDTRVECLTTVEYDGMMRFDLTLAPPGATTVDRLVLRIPFAPARAGYLIWTDCAGTGSPADERYGALPEDGWEADFLPFVWLGDEDRGMVWFCEGPVGWSAPAEGKPISVAREGDAVVMQIVMVGTPREIDGPVTYTFGLQAGPVRPRPTGGSASCRPTCASAPT